MEGAHRRLEVGQADQRAGARARARHEPQRGGGHDAEGALGADEELLEVRPGVVLAQGAQPVPEAAVGEHDLEPEHLVAHHAVAQHVDAPGIGGDDAADLAGALGADRERQEEIMLGDRVLDRLQDAARLDDGGIIVGLDGADAVEPPEAERHVALRILGQGAADQAGIAALRHDAEPEPAAGAHHGADLLGLAGAQDRECGAGPGMEPAGEEGRHVLGVGQHRAGSEFGDERPLRSFHHALPAAPGAPA